MAELQIHNTPPQNTWLEEVITDDQGLMTKEGHLEWWFLKTKDTHLE